MPKNKQYRSDALAAVHEMMVDLHTIGAIDKRTMRDFDKACLTPVQDLSAEEIRAIREHEHASQTVFAYHLNVSKNTVSQWERGEKRPDGASLKLLCLVRKKGLAAIA